MSTPEKKATSLGKLFMPMRRQNMARTKRFEICNEICFLYYRQDPILNIQWGSEIQPFKIRTFEGQISNGPVFKWSGFGYNYSPNHSKIVSFKIWIFLTRFQMIFRQFHHSFESVPKG